MSTSFVNEMIKISKYLILNVSATNFASTRLVSISALRPTAPTNPDEPIDINNPFEKERKKCILCENDISPNYKNVKLLSQFQSPYTGRTYGRHITGLCKQKQAEVQKQIALAQHCGMMPTYHKDLDFIKDPKLFDPDRPIRPHKY